MPQEEDFFGRLAAVGYLARKGQMEFWQKVGLLNKSVYTAIWPTGYGKSDGGLGAYLIARQQGRCDRLLITVPTGTQRDQYIESLKKSVARLGAAIRVFQDPDSGQQNVARMIDGSHTDTRLSWENQCEIFVTTIQYALLSGGHIADLMSKNRWMVFHDEFHKLSIAESAKWGATARRIGGDVVVGMTATPNRTDGTRTIFDGIHPDSNVTFKEAYQEQAIRGVVAHIEHYNIQVEDIDGKPITLTTQDLAGVTSFDDYELKRDLRYDESYLSDILTRSVQCLARKNLEFPGQHQMLVFAMSLKHAEFVSKILNITFGDDFSDWVGISRSDAANRGVFEKYQANRLQCLVQVEKAVEGFDNIRASVGVFLTLLRKNTIRMVQGAGRTLRRNSAISVFDKDVADLFASPDTEAADFIVSLANQTTGELPVVDEPPEPKGPEDDDITLVGVEPLDTRILDAEHDHSDIYHPTPMEVDAAKQAFEDKTGQAVSDEQVERVLRDMHRKDDALRAVQRKSAAIILTKGTVESNARRLAADAASILLGTSNRDHPRWKPMWGRLCRAVNTQWIIDGGKKAGGSLADDLQRKQEWIVRLSDDMSSTRSVPAWLSRKA